MSSTSRERNHAATPRNLNATPAIIRSAVLYVLRLALQADIPLNEGLMENVRIRLPECFLNPAFGDSPEDCPPVVGGNVETSQRVVDCLIKALGLQACSQGTMNNLIFGDGTFGYYETIAGGTGAGPTYHGTDALHSHMTNTAITDVEVLETRYPIRLHRFAIRHGSGGIGAHNGGCGLVRQMEFLAPLDVSILSQHRKTSPFGCEGGKSGKTGRQYLRRSTGEIDELPEIASFSASPGDTLTIETPGGGGWGHSPSDNE